MARGCVRTIVVWKQNPVCELAVLHVMLRENHSGMETADTTLSRRRSSSLRENHSGMETIFFCMSLLFSSLSCVRTIVVWKRQIGRILY